MECTVSERLSCAQHAAGSSLSARVSQQGLCALSPLGRGRSKDRLQARGCADGLIWREPPAVLPWEAPNLITFTLQPRKCQCSYLSPLLVFL